MAATVRNCVEVGNVTADLPRLDYEALYVALDAKRREIARETHGGISWRAVARRLGISQSTFTRLGLGGGRSLNADTLAKLLAWMGETDLKPYLRGGAS